MLPSEEVILRAAIKSDFKSANAWLDYKNSTPKNQLPNMLNWCGGYIYKNLLRLGINDEYLKGIYKHNWTSNTFRLQRLNRVLNELSRITLITPIKSFGLNNKNFNLGLRSIGDFDFYFDIRKYPKIHEKLISEGFKLFMEVSEAELVDKIFPTRGSWSYKRGNVDDLDLHWKVFDEFDLHFNRRVLSTNSVAHSSNWGEHLQLTNEMSVLIISHHHYLQGGHNYSGLCDLKHMLDQSVFGEVKALAHQLDMKDILYSQIDLINSLLNDNSLKIQAPEIKHRRGGIRQIIPFVQKNTLKNSLLYKMWLGLGARSKLEKISYKLFGTFSNPLSYMKDSLRSVSLSSEITLGMGWHYRYPGDEFQWTTYPDTRILVLSESDGQISLKIDLEPQAWSVSIPNSVQCFCNGNFMGVIQKGTSTFFLTCKVKKGWNEISFRAPKPWVRDLKKIDYNWQRLMMPVKAIRIINEGFK